MGDEILVLLLCSAIVAGCRARRVIALHSDWTMASPRSRKAGDTSESGDRTAWEITRGQGWRRPRQVFAAQLADF